MRRRLISRARFLAIVAAMLSVVVLLGTKPTMSHVASSGGVLRKDPKGASAERTRGLARSVAPPNGPPPTEVAAADSLPSPPTKSPAHSTSKSPTGCIGPPATLPPTLYVADVSGSSGLTTDEQLMFSALQGIINRTGPQIYLEGEVTDTTSAHWLEDGVVPMQRELVGPYDLLTRFKSSVKGLVVWDPSLSTDTKNVATTIAGQEDLLPVSPALATKLEAAPYNLSVKVDLRGDHFTTAAQAYGWALARFGWPRTHVLAWLGGESNGLRDLLVACRGFVFQANPEADAILVEEILNAYPQGTAVFGYPCLADPISKDTGVPVCEPVGVGEISRSGKYLIPTDLAVNLTVHAAFPAAPESPAWDDHLQVPDPTKTYVTFVISDGDNVGYNEEYLRSPQWSDPAHGSIPMGISVSPWLGVYAPRIYAYYVQTMTANDALISGPSGGGYVYPGEDSDLGGYLAQTKRLLDLDGLRAIWILDNGYLYSPSPLVVDQYVKTLHPSGIFADYFGWIVPNPPAVAFDQGVPVVHAVWGSCVADTVGRIELGAAAYPGRPSFVFVALNTWSMGFSAAQKVMSQLGPNYVAVRPDRFIGLLDGAKSLGPAAASAPPLPSDSNSPSAYCIP